MSEPRKPIDLTPDANMASLTDEQRQLMALLLQEAGVASPSSQAIGPRADRSSTDGSRAPLSFAQSRMWFLYRQAPHDPSYNIQTAQRLRGPLDQNALSAALNGLVARHEALRTGFRDEGESTWQVVAPLAPLKINTYALKPDEDLNGLIAEAALKPWDLTQTTALRVTLIRCNDNDHVLLLGMHHILSDAWSVGLLARELWQAYAAALEGREPQWPGDVLGYADYAVWEQTHGLAGLAKDRQYWVEQLKQAPTQLTLPLDVERHQAQAGAAAMHVWRFGAASTQAIHQLAQASRCSVFAICLAGFYLLLGELTARRDVLVASPVANRERAELESVMGYFANTVVLRGQWHPSLSFEALVNETQEQSLEALAHQRLPFEQLVQAINPPRLAGVHPLAQVFFAFQQAVPEQRQIGELSVTAHEHDTRQTQFDLETHVWQTDDGLIDAVMIYPPLLTTTTIERWATRYEQLLLQAASEPLRCVSSWITPAFAPPQPKGQAWAKWLQETAQTVPGVTGARAIEAPIEPDERLTAASLYDPARLPGNSGALSSSSIDNTQPHIGSDTQSDTQSDTHSDTQSDNQSNTQTQNGAWGVPTPRSSRPALASGGTGPALHSHNLAELLINAASEHPQSACWFLPSGQRLSLPELVSHAQGLQQQLVQQGVRPGELLLFQLDDEQAIITHFWGAVFAGATPLVQLPVDVSQTQAHEQLVATWHSLGQPTVLVDAPCALAWAEHGAKTIDIDELAAAAPADPASSPAQGMANAGALDDIAFYSLSSGTSGVPKAIGLTHRNVISRALAAAQATDLDASRVLLNWQPMNHIASLSDWHIRGICAGCTMIFGQTRAVLAEPTVWLDWISRHHVTDTWAPNFAFSRLDDALGDALGAQMGQEGQEAAKRNMSYNLTSLKRWLCAGESIVPAVLERLLDKLAPWGLAPDVMQPAFGMAETASGTTYYQPSLDQPLKRQQLADQSRFYVSCGTPIAGIEVRIVNTENQLLVQGEVGHVQFRGAPVFGGYRGLAALNATVFTDDGWFESGDLGFLWEDSLYVTGRDKAELIVNGRNLSCESIEIAIGELPGVQAGAVAACTVQRREDDTDKIAICFATQGQQPIDEVKRSVRALLAASFGMASDYLLAVPAQRLPRTSLGKLRRGLLASQINDGAFDAEIQSQKQQAATVPESFFHKTWHYQPLMRLTEPAQPVYVVASDTDLARAVTLRLSHLGIDNVRVPDAGALAKDCPESPTLLVLDLLETPQTTPGCLERACQSALHIESLLQTLPDSLRQAHARLVVATANAQPTGHEPGAQLKLGDAGVGAQLQSAAQGLGARWVCQHVDLDDSALALKADMLVEMLCSPADEPEVAYRQARRLVPRMAPLAVRASATQGVWPWREDGFVLISGGLGGIGQILARELHDVHGMALLLVGRQPWHSESNETETSAQAKAFVQAREHVHYASLDVADSDALHQLVAMHEQATGRPLAGVIHLAGVGHWQTSDAPTPEAWQGHLRAKVAGTENLFELVHQRPGACFVGVGSVIGEFGAPGLPAYASANRFLAAFCRAQTQMGHQATFGVQWPAWRDTGMSAGQPEVLAQAAGYHTLAPGDAWHMWLACLLGQHDDVVVGLNANHPARRTQADTHLYYTSEDPARAQDGLAALTAHPYLLDHAPVWFEAVAQLPGDEVGTEVESTATAAGAVHRREISEALAGVFREVMKLDHIALDDNFFELGAHSLMLASLEHRLKSEVSDQVSLLDLFRFPTIDRLARHLASQTTTHGPSEQATTGHADKRQAQASVQASRRQARTAHRRQRS